MRQLFLVPILLYSFIAFSQPDTALMMHRQKVYLVTGTAAFYGLSVLGMDHLWYKNYKRTSFHWDNDSREWLQMDKTGHFFSSYLASRTLSRGFESVGINHGKSLIYASGLSFLGISTIEIFDGLSEGWGASSSDLLVNALGVALFTAQALLWDEEKIIPKLSYHPTSYAASRPEILGSNFPERLLKDYNGHTLWLSFNIKSISGTNCLPDWLCLSTGYGAEGMISGYDDPNISPYIKRYRQFYLSLDADLKKINTRYKTLNFVIHSLNFVKIPFPTLIFTASGLDFHAFYF